MKKVLFCASTLSHLMNFHLPYLQDFRDQGYEVWTLAGGGKARFIPYAHHQEDLPIRKRFFSPKNLLAILKVRRLLLRENQPAFRSRAVYRHHKNNILTAVYKV